MTGHSSRLVVIFVLAVSVTAAQSTQFNATQAVETSQDHYQRGTMLYDKGRYREAMEAFQQAINLKPDYALAYNGLGMSARNLGQYKEAIRALQKAIQFDPTLIVAYRS